MLALVIGNAACAAFPPLPACAESAHAVAGALRLRGFDVGFDVLARDAPSSGELRAALSTFERRLFAADAPLAHIDRAADRAACLARSAARR